MTARTRLVMATAEHLDWARLGDESTPGADGLRLPPGGLESPDVLAWIAQTAASVEEATGERGVWLMVDEPEVVGLISLKGPPREGVVEIGYGVALPRRARGHATRAVALLVAEAAHRGWSLVAETAADNRASQVALERNGFERIGGRQDAVEGHVLVWQHRPPRATPRRPGRP